MAPPGATRPSWSGLLQLSLVGIPLKAYPAVRTREVTHLHQLHAHCGQRIRYAKQCPLHGAVDTAAIVKGYEHGSDQHLVLEPEDPDPLRPTQDRALRLERFVDPDHFDPVLLSGRSLQLLLNGSGEYLWSPQPVSRVTTAFCLSLLSTSICHLFAS
jgi:non-homologous end joining protein Ku